MVWIAVLGALLGTPVARAADLQSGPEVLAFEDVEGSGSDGDQNDTVIRWARLCRFDASGHLAAEVVHVAAVAAGASFTNTLGLRLAGPATVDVTRGGEPTVTVPQDGSHEVVVYADFRDAFAAPTTGFVNTDDATIVAGEPTVIEVTYTTPIVLGSMSCSIPSFRLRRAGVDIATTSTLPGGRPMAWSLPDGWDVATEHVSLDDAYPQVTAWATSRAAGCTPGVSCVNEAWHLNPVAGLVQTRGPLTTTAPLPAFASCTSGVQDDLEAGVDCGGPWCAACVVPRVVFVTAAAYQGNFSGTGFWADTDAKCAVEAASASLPGTFRAWISRDGSPPSNARTRFNTGVQGPWYLTTGALVATSFTDLVNGDALAHAIDRGPAGQLISGQVWGNNYSDGTAVGANVDCLGWTNTGAFNGNYGLTTSVNLWYGGANGVCSTSRHLYCFEWAAP